MICDRRGLLAGAATAVLVPRPLPGLAAKVSATNESLQKLTIGPTTVRLRPDGAATNIAGFVGPEPLPVIRMKAGERRAIPVENELAEPVALRLIGLRGQAWLDKAVAIAPGQSGALELQPPDSGTYLFRAEWDAASPASRNLTGLVLVEDAKPAAVDQDIELVTSDWRIGPDNQLADMGQPGDTILGVNGRLIPLALTFRPGSRLRVRLVNASARRVMVVACDGARPMILAIDGQPSELFEPVRDTVPIGPGSRFDYALDLPREPGKSVRFVLKGTEQASTGLEPDRVLAEIKTEGQPLDPKGPITPLPPNPGLPRQIPLEKAKRAELVIEGKPGTSWSVNGVAGTALPRAPLLKVKQGEAVVLGFTNKSSLLVPLRVEGQALRLLHAKDDGWEPYWRESVMLQPGSHNHVAFVADGLGRFVVEGGFEDQRLAGLRAWFVVERA